MPEGWEPRIGGDPVVTAAVQDPVEAPALLRAAFEESRARSAGLVVLHAWWLASGFDVVVVDTAYRDEFATRGHEELEPVLAPLRAEFPDVQVTVTVQHAPPVEAVLDAAEKSDLLVLGRRHHRSPRAATLVRLLARPSITAPARFSSPPSSVWQQRLPEARTWRLRGLRPGPRTG